MTTKLAQARGERDWTKTRLVHALRTAARNRGRTLPQDASLLRRIAVWENQGGAVSDFYIELLCEVYGKSALELGLVTFEEPPSALRVLDSATDVLPDAGEQELPYVMLDAGHLARWRGHCLARLGEASAIEELAAALLAMGEGHYGRAEVSLRVDLALAFRARGDINEAHLHARRASELAGRTGSKRQRRRIKDLLVA
ncbi:hypothetical protein [Pseudonocardia sp. NPDC049154]|uniref:hypothetical protein n=1 Tax=Pseudonocardia sp. NPDC049154 TaxID=3155501 RepID=UPI0033EFD537